MLKVALIGASHLELDVMAPENTESHNISRIYSNYGGTIRNVSHNLALMGIPNSFCTKLGNDMDAVNIWNQLKDLNVDISGPTINLPTPKKLVLMPKQQKQTVYWDRPADFLFNKNDSLSYPIFQKADICLTDIKDDDVLNKLIDSSPDSKWILSHFIPNKEVLSKLWGLVINYSDALSLGKPSEFERICYRLCQLGPSWVIIAMNYQGVYLYQDKNGTHYPTKCHGEGYANGCYSAFLSGLTAGLALQANLDSSVKLALVAQKVTYQSPDIVNPAIKDLFRKRK